jgi:integrase
LVIPLYRIRVGVPLFCRTHVNEEIAVDPFRKLGEITETEKEKGVLTFEERQKLTELPAFDYRTRLVMLLGSYCGLRRGEMRGLQWGDISGGIISVQHNFLNKEGLKQPKCNSARKVPVTSAVREMLDTAWKYALNTSPEGYIFESSIPGIPLSNNFFRDGVRKELEGLGERLLTCHSLRHTFITLARLSGISDVEIMALAGHKSEKVMKKYSHAPQVIDFDKAREKIEMSGDVRKGQKVANE